MNIAVFADSYEPYISGVVRSIQTVTDEFVALGHRVWIFAPSYSGRKGKGVRERSGEYTGSNSGSKATEDANPKVFRYLSVATPMYQDFTIAVPFSASIHKVIEEIRPDVIHSHSPFMMGRLGASVAARHRIPLVFTHHTMYHEYVHYAPIGGKVVKRMILKWLASYCRKSDLVVAPSSAVENVIKDLYGYTGPVRVVPTGVKLEEYRKADPAWMRNQYGIPQDWIVSICVCRLAKEKSPGKVLEAFGRTALRDSKLGLVMVGSGPLRSELEAYASGLGIRDRVIFTGSLPHNRVVDCYMGSDLFLFASTTETQGLVTLEAMAAGLPVVAVDGPGTSDLVDSGENGLLTSNDAEELGSAFVKLAGDPELRKQMGAKARLKAESFSSTAMARKLLDLYAELPAQQNGVLR